MAQWSQPILLKEVVFYQGFLSHPGVYELGLMDGQGFSAMYIGMANRSLYMRLVSYTTSRCHNPRLALFLRKQDDPVWCRVCRSDDAGFTEARAAWQQESHGAGQYDWNRGYEARGARGTWQYD